MRLKKHVLRLDQLPLKANRTAVVLSKKQPLRVWSHRSENPAVTQCMAISSKTNLRTPSVILHRSEAQFVVNGDTRMAVVRPGVVRIPSALTPLSWRGVER